MKNNYKLQELKPGDPLYQDKDGLFVWITNWDKNIVEFGQCDIYEHCFFVTTTSGKTYYIDDKSYECLVNWYDSKR